MRNLSQNTLYSINSLETGEAFLFLVTIRHPDIADGPIRVVNNTVNIWSNGNEYIAYAFKLSLAIDDGQTLPVISLTIDNIDRKLIEAVRALTSSPEFDLHLVLSSNPNIIEMRLEGMTLIEVEYDAQRITGNLIAGDLLNAPYPSDAITPAQYPGLFY